jgi:ABC-2 type transport system ATP-binding protein
MTDRPHTFRIRSGDDRRLAAALVADEAVFGTELTDGRLTVRVGDYGAFTALLPRLARSVGVSLYEVAPTDDSLESVFSYLVRR